jgi:predicted ChrR family anti-sigma factor
MIDSISNTLLKNLGNMEYASVDWQDFREGVSIFPIYSSDSSLASSALLKYVPGASVPRHQHTGYEHIFVLEGSQEDERGVYVKGDFIVNKPGTNHWVKSADGCVVLAIWEKPVQFV